MTTMGARLVERFRRSREIALAVGLAAAVVLAVLVLWATRGGDGSTPATATEAPAAVELYRGPDAVTDTGPWRSVAARGVELGAASVPGGGDGVSVRLGEGRDTFTVVQRTFAAPQDWTGRRLLYLDFRGTASGAAYTFFIDFEPAHRNSATYSLVDGSNAWTVVPFELGATGPGRTRADWSHVVSVRIATDSKSSTGSFALGEMRLAAPLGG